MVDYAEDQFDPEQAPFRLRQRWWSGIVPGTRPGSRRLRRVGLAFITFGITVCLFAACAAGLLFLRLSNGPVAISLESQVSKALAARVRHGFTFDVGGTDVETVDGRPALVVKQLLVKDEAGRSVIRAPQATISVDPLQLLSGVIVPTRLDVHDITLKLSILPDGDVALSTGTDERLPFRLSEAFDSAAPSPTSLRPPDASRSLPRPDGALSSVASENQRDVVERFAAALAPLLDKFTGADDALGGFDRLGVARGMLVLDDRSHNSVKTFRNLNFDFDKVGENASRVTLAADGAAGRWSVTLRGTRHADARRSVSLEMQNLTLDDLRIVPGLRDPGFDADVPVSATVDIGLDPSGALSVGRGRIGFGSGYFRLNDPDHEPVLIDRIDTSFHFDVATKRLVFDPSRIRAGTTSYDFEGEVGIPGSAIGDWTIAAHGSGIFGPERPNEKPIALERIDVGARVNAEQHRFRIDRLDVAGPQVALGLQAEIQSTDAGVRVRTTATAGRMPAPVIVRLWPSLISAQVRSWLLSNLQGGVVERGKVSADLDDADLAKIKVQRSVADGHLQLDYAVSDVTLSFMAGVPPLRGLTGTGVVTGDTSKFAVSRGWMEVAQGRQLALADGGLNIPSTDPKPTPAVITAHVNGGVDVLSELLSRDAFKSYAALPPEAASAKGQIDGTLTVGLNLGGPVKQDDLKVGATAKISGLVIEKLIGKQSLTDGDILLVLDKTGLKAKGDASIFGAPTSIDIKKPAGTGAGEANIVLTLDDAARVKAGFNLGRTVTGPVTARINTALGITDRKATIDIDLTRAALNNPMPGLSKSVGKPGKVTLTATQHDNGVGLDNIVCDVGAFSVRGSADLDSNGNFQAARLSQARLSPGDEMKVDVQQASDVLKIVMRGANLDARPFLKTLSSADGPEGSGKDIDLELHSNLLTGQNSQVLTGVDLRLVRRGGQTRKLQLNGRFGRAPVAISSIPQGNVLTVNASSADAGASLAFLDLYKRVSGGQLDTNVRMFDGRMDGTATIREFGLKEDPAMKRLTEESLTQAKSGDTHIDASNLSFTKLSILFSKTGSKIEVKDGVIFGPQMGATVRGSIDFSRDKVALAGTFVPIYGINNLFAQLPLVGPILGGGAHEGLFGLNYKINGPMGTPNLTVDPLSALAPGFLRNIFGAISEAAQESAAPSPQRVAPDRDPVAR